MLCMFLSACVADAWQVINTLDRLLSITVLIICIVVFGEYRRLLILTRPKMTPLNHISWPQSAGRTSNIHRCHAITFFFIRHRMPRDTRIVHVSAQASLRRGRLRGH